MRHDKIDIWMKFFRLCNHKTSAGTLTQYFYHQFLIYPEESGVFFREIESLLADESEDQERNHMIHQYIHFLSPIYDQFRPYDTKCQLDDLYLRYAHPEMYNQIQAGIQDLIDVREEGIQEIGESLQTLGKDLGIPCSVSGRVKNVFSTYQKMKRYATSNVDDIRDLLGFRIIVDTDQVEDCYAILNEIHDRYTPDVKNFKDYIVIPKINGYQSIHTGIRGVGSDEEALLEIQIRTKQMEKRSREGFASHLSYKMQVSKKTRGQESSFHMGFDDKTQKGYEKKSVFVLSRDFDLMRTHKGTTVMDFAHKVHSSIPKKLMGALVNNDFQDASYVLQEGDIVSLVTHPKRNLGRSLQTGHKEVTHSL